MTEIVSNTDLQQFIAAVTSADSTNAIIAGIGFFILYYGKKISKVMSTKLEDVLDNLSESDCNGKALNTKLATSNQIKNITRDYFNNTRAFKVLIMQFHNGSKLLNGAPFLKCSCTHELINPNSNGNKNPVQNNYLGVPITLFAFYLNQLKRKTLLVIQDIEEIKDQDYGAYLRLKQLGAGSVIISGLYKDGVLIGCVSSLFDKIEDTDLTNIKKQARILANKVDILFTDDREEEESIN